MMISLLGLMDSSMPRTTRIAVLAHETNRVYCHLQNMDLPPAWSDLSDNLKASAITGVRLRLEGGDNCGGAEFFHGEWMKARLEAGWTYGASVDHEKKTHPCLCPYSELPENQRLKDSLFDTAVRLGDLLFSSKVTV